jgi:peptidoglycan/LPS O-acetylase OafA/YrhL
LDGIRAIAVGFVIFAHLCGTDHFPLPAERHLEILGPFGVQVFFVISGYLITSILVSEQERKGTIRLARFYFRRTLRLLPASWVFITVAALLGLYGILPIHRPDLWFAYTYTSNYINTGGSSVLGHLWSLAVEEQFYLLWPCILAFAGRERGKRVLWVLICLAPICRLLSYPLWPFMNFWSFSDNLATGCLLALMQKELHVNLRYQALMQSRLLAWIPVIAVAANYIPSTKIYWVVGEPLQNVLIAICIDWAMQNPGRGVGRFLNWPVVALIGVMSYSLYLWQQIFSVYGVSGWVAGFPQNLILTFAAALGSYLLVEGPVLRLRERLETRRLEVLQPQAR